MKVHCFIWPKDAHFYHLQRYIFVWKSEHSFVIFFSEKFCWDINTTMKGKEGFSVFHLQSLRIIAVNKSFPFLFAPIGNGKSIDGKDRLVFLVGGNA